MTTQEHALSLKDALEALNACPAVLSVEQAARAVGLSMVTIRRRIQHGSLRAARTSAGRGGRYRILKRDVAAMLVEMS